MKHRGQTSNCGLLENQLISMVRLSVAHLEGNSRIFKNFY